MKKIIYLSNITITICSLIIAWYQATEISFKYYGFYDFGKFIPVIILLIYLIILVVLFAKEKKDINN